MEQVGAEGDGRREVEKGDALIHSCTALITALHGLIYHAHTFYVVKIRPLNAFINHTFYTWSCTSPVHVTHLSSTYNKVCE